MRLIAIKNAVPFHVLNYSIQDESELETRLNGALNRFDELLFQERNIAEALDLAGLLMKHGVWPAHIAAGLYMTDNSYGKIGHFYRSVSSSITKFIKQNTVVDVMTLMNYLMNEEAAVIETCTAFNSTLDAVDSQDRNETISVELLQGDALKSFVVDETSMRNSFNNTLSRVIRTCNEIVNSGDGQVSVARDLGSHFDWSMELHGKSESEQTDYINAITTEASDMLDRIERYTDGEGLNVLNEDVIIDNLNMEILKEMYQVTANLTSVLASGVTLKSDHREIPAGNISRANHIVHDYSDKYVVSNLKPILIRGSIFMVSSYLDDIARTFDLIDFYVIKRIITFAYETPEFWSAIRSRRLGSSIARVSKKVFSDSPVSEVETFRFMDFYAVSDTNSKVCTGLIEPFGILDKNDDPMAMPLSYGVHCINGIAKSGKDALVATIQESLNGQKFIDKDDNLIHLSNNDMVIIDMMERSSKVNSEIEPRRTRVFRLDSLIDSLSNRSEKVIFINSITNLIETLGVGETTATGLKQTSYDSVVSALNTFGEAKGKVIFVIARGNIKQIPYLTGILSGASWSVLTAGPTGPDENDAHIVSIISRETSAGGEPYLMGKDEMFGSLDKYRARSSEAIDKRLDFLV